MKIKENVLPQPPLSLWWLCLAIVTTVLTIGIVELIDQKLPEPLIKETAPKERFIAGIAHEHLINLTSIGPRVAGSYESEVVAVGVLAAAVRRIARAAAPHHRVELHLHTASGAFPLTFLDGMNNVYRGVQSVVARVSPAGGRPPPPRARTALLLNCHFDTWPDSPGASDDGAGCAVLLETMRALAASPSPLRHDAVFLFNGAEENIMQASHGFITQHKWARSVRAFINIEACGAGGREVLFQAGPHDPWLMEVYAGAVPHPFASSLAQELFESGLIPADTDFRIFRDFGKLSGVDLAWSSNGYVYHTALDTADRVPLPVLQRTGDNVLALARGILSSESIESEVDVSSRQPVFFDVLGVVVVSARAPAAAAAALLAAALVLARLLASAHHARRTLFVSRGAWWRVVWRACGWLALAHAAGVLAGALPAALLLHAARARLAFYTRTWLLAPLYALPALAVTWAVLARWRPGGAYARGWWRAHAVGDAAAGAWGVALAASACARLRSGFLPLLWAALPALAELAALAGRAPPAARAAAAAAAGLLPALQTWYMALNWLHIFVPVMGRAGDAPADVVMAVLVATVVLIACSWMLPLVVATRQPRKLVWGALAVCAAACVLAVSSPLGAPYSRERPQRFLVFHVRRTHHPHHPRAPLVDTRQAPAAASRNLFWLPHLDVNTPHSVDEYVPLMREAQATDASECASWPYCGAPYYLPVLSFISRGYTLPARNPPPPAVRLHARVWTAPHNDTARSLHLHLTGPNRVVVVLSPAEGARAVWAEGAGVSGVAGVAGAAGALLAGPAWGARATYFVSLYDARQPAHWRLHILLLHERGAGAACGAGDGAGGGEGACWATLSLSGHALAARGGEGGGGGGGGAGGRHAEHAQLLDAFPQWAVPSGWPVDMHLMHV